MDVIDPTTRRANATPQNTVSPAAPVPLAVPPAVNVVAVDLSVQLEHLAYKVQNTHQGGISNVG